jgi:hypothetical protein
MGTSTIMTVPEWAYEYVTLYAERARALSAAMGTEPRLPSTAVLEGGVGWLVNPELAYDGSASTYAYLLSPDSNNSAWATYSGFAAAVEAYTSLSLRATVSVIYPATGDPEGEGIGIMYSLDGGSTWTYMWAGGKPLNISGTPKPGGGGFMIGNRATVSVALPIGTDLTQVQIKFGAHTRDNGDNLGFYIYEITTAGYFALPEGSTGALQVYSGPIFAAQNQDEIDGIAGLAIRGRYGDQVITKAIAYEDDVINGGYLPGTKAPFLAALASVTENSSLSFAAFLSRIGRKPYYVGDSDSTYLAQTLVSGAPAIYNARISAAIYADNFRKERVIQDHALGYGVEMGKHAAIDGETLRRAGLYQREYVQYGYTMSHKLFLEEQELAVVNLEIFGNCLRALTGSQQTTTADSPGGNKLTAAVGMGMATGVAGWYIGASIGWVGGPAGAAVGFAVGAIAGYLLS